MARRFLFERKHEPLLSRQEFVKRMMMSILLAATLLSVTISSGTLGFHFLESQAWMDALLNAVMVMSGLGVDGGIHTFGGKWFAVVYVLVSAFIFYSSLALLFAPPLHRLLHHFHLDAEENAAKARRKT